MECNISWLVYSTFTVRFGDGRTALMASDERIIMDDDGIVHAYISLIYNLRNEHMPMYPTKNDLPIRVRENVIGLLQPRLAECIDLSLQAKQAHWNVKGENFIALHKMFDKVHQFSREAVDLIAERIMQLGGSANGTSQAVSKFSNLPPYPFNIIDGREHVEAISSSLAYFSSEIRSIIPNIEGLHDSISADILVQIAREADMQLWFVESHLFQKVGELNEKSLREAG